jgi:hypothetical protein
MQKLETEFHGLLPLSTKAKVPGVPAHYKTLTRRFVAVSWSGIRPGSRILGTMVAVLLFLWASVPEPWLWQDPGAVESVDFRRPARNAEEPKPPFTYLREDSSGTSPKLLVRDASGVIWQVKGGPEARTEAFATRLIAALGYFAEPVCFLKEGRLEGFTGKLTRRQGFIRPDGTFAWASFERREPGAKFLPSVGWTWQHSPFASTKELNGLKILIMLLSNWDNKDMSNQWKGPNTGVLEMTVEGRLRRIYFITDWGQSLGAWGRWASRSQWDCAAYRKQSASFITGIQRGALRFGYTGQHTEGFRDGITPADAAWLMQYLGRVTDAQLRTGLLVSGASPEEQECFVPALRERVEQVRRAATSQPAAIR